METLVGFHLDDQVNRKRVKAISQNYYLWCFGTYRITDNSFLIGRMDNTVIADQDILFSLHSVFIDDVIWGKHLVQMFTNYHPQWTLFA